ncbi:hypothetical protein G9C85_18245 [Halorubellus sp. JP-L1]|uniref:twin-arginine translocation signal domain-containing protein n=1 Tax=Halorubellus sp. JP-L1 TaxID=2715753 RepID=UPI0014076D38|nr:twin-arginine translocation signal domain-containing protein [Halorubellus sp. JP-L1]NHN43563.1 hypothetical protein [Halorubellus sp. JP-L1]
MDRRTFLRAGGVASAAGLAGCFGLLETRSARSPPVLSDRPDAVYFPTHVEGMQMGGMGKSGDYAAMAMYSYPHRFWNVNGTTVEQTPIEEGDDAHIMVNVFDPETKRVLPDAGVSIEITSDGESVSQETIYPMLSQPMAFHYGANFDLGDVDAATLTVDVSIGGVTGSGVTTTGDYDGRFEEGATIPLELTYSQAEKQGISFRETPEKAGERTARKPMEMDAPLGVAPAPGDLPGRVLGDPANGEPRSGDAVFAATVVDADRFDGRYLAVSPRTPYNGFVIPRMGIAATVDRDGETVYDDSLGRTLDPEIGYHYGAPVDVQSGDEVTLSVTTPAQVARHEGYETAFLDFEDVTLTA